MDRMPELILDLRNIRSMLQGIRYRRRPQRVRTCGALLQIQPLRIHHDKGGLVTQRSASAPIITFTARRIGTTVDDNTKSLWIPNG